MIMKMYSKDKSTNNIISAFLCHLSLGTLSMGTVLFDTNPVKRDSSNVNWDSSFGHKLCQM